MNNVTAMAEIDLSVIEKRIMENWKMIDTVLDVYGTEISARKALFRALVSERRFGDLDIEKKDAFIEWAFGNANLYKDGSKIDFIGAFYDWLEL